MDKPAIPQVVYFYSGAWWVFSPALTNQDKLDFRMVRGLSNEDDLTIGVGGGGIRISLGSHNVVLAGLNANDIVDLNILV